MDICPHGQPIGGPPRRAPRPAGYPAVVSPNRCACCARIIANAYTRCPRCEDSSEKVQDGP